MTGCILNFQLKEIIVVSPGVSIPSLGIKPSRPVEHKEMGTGCKNIAIESLGAIVSGTTPISTP